MDSVTGMQKALAVAAHLGYFLGGVGYLLVPFLIWQMKKGDAFVAQHARQAFWIQAFSVFVTLLIIAAAFVMNVEVAVTVGILVQTIAWVLFSIVAAVKAINGEYYTYPVLSLCGMKKPEQI